LTIQKIIKYPNESLREKTKAVSFPLTDEVKEHIQDLRDTLNDTNDGLALASNQISPNGWQIFVDRHKAYINPVWNKYEDSELSNVVESCLSIPGLHLEIDRYNEISFKFQDESGNEHFTRFTGISAQEIQHECEHLNGKLFIDNLEPEVLKQVRREYLKFKNNLKTLDKRMKEITRK
jgi:peptide deformylase